MAAMALEDRIQAAVERQVAAVSAGHAQELQNVQEQLQQTLDRRTQVITMRSHSRCHASRGVQP